MPKVPFTVDKEFRKFDPTSIDAPQIGVTVRDDQAHAFRVIGLALLVVFCGALGIVATTAFNALG